MKKISLLVILLASIYCTQAQTTLDDVLNKFLQAHGGKERLLTINTMQVESSLKLGQMGMTINMNTYRDNNKLFRLQTSNPMGGEESYTIISDTAGYSYTPAMNGPMGSMEASLIKFSADEFVANNYQKDCAGMFAMLVNYTEKGSTASLEGTEKVNGTECNKVKLVLKTGQQMLFFIAEKNGQVKRLQLAANVGMQMMGMGGMARSFGGNANKNKLAERKIDMDFDKYKIFDGFPFPTLQTISFGATSFELENTKVVINKPIDAKWYKVK